MKIPRNCDNETCKKEYVAETRELKRGNGIYCSLKCSGEVKSRKLQKARESKDYDAYCAVCNEGIYVTSRRRKNNKSGIFFCSRQHQFDGFKDPNINVSPGPQRMTKTCSNCPRTLRSEVNSLCKFCTKIDKINRWLSGDISVTWSSTTKEPKTFVKEYLLKTRGDKCENCGFDRKRPDGTSKIQMDHIDGDYTNNHIDNLRLLCPNCHDDTETYGSRNRNGGRRYRLGK